MNLIESTKCNPSPAYFALQKQALVPSRGFSAARAAYAVSYIPECVETSLLSEHYHDESPSPDLPKEETTRVVMGSCFGEFPLNMATCSKKDTNGYSVYRRYILVPKSVAVRVDCLGDTPELRRFLEVFRRKDTPWAHMQDAVTFRECPAFDYTMIVADICVDPKWSLDQLLQLLIALKLYREDKEVVDTLLRSIDDPNTFLYGAHPVFALAVGVSVKSHNPAFSLRTDQWFVYPIRGDECSIDWGNLNKPMKASTRKPPIDQLVGRKCKNEPIDYGLPCELLENSFGPDFADIHIHISYLADEDCVEDRESMILGESYNDLVGHHFTFHKILREDGVIVYLDTPTNPQTLMEGA